MPFEFIPGIPMIITLGVPPKILQEIPVEVLSKYALGYLPDVSAENVLQFL